MTEIRPEIASLLAAAGYEGDPEDALEAFFDSHPGIDDAEGVEVLQAEAEAKRSAPRAAPGAPRRPPRQPPRGPGGLRPTGGPRPRGHATSAAPAKGHGVLVAAGAGFLLGGPIGAVGAMAAASFLGKKKPGLAGYGDFGSHSMLQVQQALAARGFDPGPIDGKNGPRTRAAVEEFQRVAGLTVDGIVGPQTEASLFAAGTTPSASTVHEPGPPSSSSGGSSTSGGASHGSGAGMALPILGVAAALLLLKR